MYYLISLHRRIQEGVVFAGQVVVQTYQDVELDWPAQLTNWLMITKNKRPGLPTKSFQASFDAPTGARLTCVNYTILGLVGQEEETILSTESSLANTLRVIQEIGLSQSQLTQIVDALYQDSKKEQSSTETPRARRDSYSLTETNNRARRDVSLPSVSDPDVLRLRKRSLANFPYGRYGGGFSLRQCAVLVQACRDQGVSMLALHEMMNEVLARDLPGWVTTWQWVEEGRLPEFQLKAQAIEKRANALAARAAI